MPCLLLVEDHRLARVVLSEGLQEKGFNVVEAESAEQAMDLWTADMFDLVLSDIRLPGADGIALAHYIRSDIARIKSSKYVRLIALSGATLSPEDSDRIADSFDVVLEKPIEMGALVKVLRNA